MTSTIEWRRFCNRPGPVLREVEKGRSFSVTHQGKPMAELRPLGPRRFVPRATLESQRKHLPRIDAGRFRRDLDTELDSELES